MRGQAGKLVQGLLLHRKESVALGVGGSHGDCLLTVSYMWHLCFKNIKTNILKRYCYSSDFSGDKIGAQRG